jgi:hypothetical protein
MGSFILIVVTFVDMGKVISFQEFDSLKTCQYAENFILNNPGKRHIGITKCVPK